MTSTRAELERTRTHVAKRVRELRTERRLTQAELARRLGLSQNRLSEVERGGGSFTAEQLLVMAQLFNVAPSEFAPRRPEQTRDDELQNALARLGATHLVERDDVTPSERFDGADGLERAVRETLASAHSPRLVTALAPVLVRHAGALRAQRLLPLDLSDERLERRVRWLLDNTLAALASEQAQPMTRAWSLLYRQAHLRLSLCVEALDAHRAYRPEERGAAPVDALDADIRSARSLAEALEGSSAISKRWRIATGIQPEDFAAALQGARDAA